MVEKIVMERKENGLVGKLTGMDKRVFWRYKRVANDINDKNWANAERNVYKISKEPKYMTKSISAAERNRLNSKLSYIIDNKVDAKVSFYVNKNGTIGYDL